jgi:hypothetical protein
VLGLQ